MRNKRGFSLVELLVVMALITIIAGLVTISFGGASETARAAQCANNMRTLAAAIMSYSDTLPATPIPSFDANEDNSAQQYTLIRSWIASDWYGRFTGSTTGGRAQDGMGFEREFVKCETVSTYDDTPVVTSDGRKLTKSQWCVENGALFPSVNNLSAYVCPTHAKIADGKNLKPAWSYVANVKMRYDYMDGEDAVGDVMAYAYQSTPALNLSGARTIVLAEMPAVNICGEAPSFSKQRSDKRTDQALLYKNEPYWRGKGEPWEYIGFNHGDGQFAHVVFADQHFEKLQLPLGNGSGSKSSNGKKASRDNLIDLTMWLCNGNDICFEHGEYVNTDDIIAE